MRDRLPETLELRSLFEVFENASAFIAVLTGPDHIYESANRQYRELMGNRDFVGKAVRDVVPDVADQGFFELLDEVYRTGKPYIGRDISMVIRREGHSEPQKFKIDLLYSAMTDADGRIFGIFVEGQTLAGPFASKPLEEKPLTDRERDVLRWVALGKTADETGSILGISKRTIEFHLRSAGLKLNTSNSVHTVAEALRKKII